MARLAAKIPANDQMRQGFGIDPILLIITVIILAIGIVMVTSSGYMIAAGKYGDGFYYTKKQGLAMLLGLGLMLALSRIKPFFWQRVAAPLLACGIFLLVLVLIPGIGIELGGSHRWIKVPLGFYVQPSELIKYAVIIFFAGSLAKKGEGIRDFAIGFLPHVLVMGLVVFLLLMQPDFGSAVIVACVGFLMLFVAGVRLQYLIGSVILCLPFLLYIAVSANYRVARLRSFLDPWGDPLNSGFQIIQSLVAFGCGGVWGVGIGKGIQKLFYLPQPHTDFVFSVVGEELGLLGVATVIILFYLLVWRGLMAAIKSSDDFGKFLAFGITTLVGLQAMVNMAVAMGLLPTKGLPLPFVSLGGTSLVMNLAGMGILMAIIRSRVSEQRKGAR